MPWNLTGHEWAANLLCQHVARGEMRHAYLITGPAGVGRRTLALRLAQAVNCTQPPAPGEPCGACRSCTQIERMSHPDLSILQAGREGGEIPVDAVRQLQHSLNLAPYEARYRVALLLRFEEANPSAQNALLKTLEEAPERVILLLTAENAEALLPTIVSRCEILRLRPLPLDVVRESLAARGIPAEQATLLAHICGGRAGLAFRLSHDGAQMEQRAAWLDDLWRLLHANRAERFAYAEHAASARANTREEREKIRENLRQMALTWLSFWRDVLLRAAGAAAPLTNPDQAERVEQAAIAAELSGARKVITALEDCLPRLANANLQLLVESLLLDLPRLRDLPNRAL
jgi:DNA polymerase-3 subunit delta'